MTRTALPACAGLVAMTAVFAPAAIPVIGGPTYDATSGTGYQAHPTDPYAIADTILGEGTVLTSMTRYTGGQAGPSVPVSWNAGGSTAYALPTLTGATTPLGEVGQVNAAGVAAGSQMQYGSGNGFTPGQAIRWNAPNSPVVLANAVAGTNVSSYAGGIDPAGTAVGSTRVYQFDTSGVVQNAYDLPVRWAAGVTTATLLNTAAATGRTVGSNTGDVAGIDAAGTTYGSVAYNSGAAGSTTGGNYATTAVRWAAGGTALAEMAHAIAPAGGFVDDYVSLVRPNGTLAGKSEFYVNGIETRSAPTRWAADGSVTVLDLPAGATATSGANRVTAMADTGVAVGRYGTTSSVFDGLRPVRWDAGTSAATPLGLLGTPTATTSAFALGVNDAGVAVGVQRTSGTAYNGTAVLWGADGVAVDLNTLIDPESGWRLTEADSITDSGYVAGVGLYDPDGTGPAAAYTRSFLIRVPEPATPGAVAAGVVLLGRRRRR